MNTMSTRLISLVAAAVAISAPLAPPAHGDSAVDQYTESIPTAGGDQPTADIKVDQSEPDVDEAPISPEGQEQFEAAGEDGVAASDVAQATSPRQAKDKDTEQGDKQRKSTHAEPSAERPTYATKAAALGQSDGMGIWFPLMLGASLIWGIATMISRRRRPGRE